MSTGPSRLTLRPPMESPGGTRLPMGGRAARAPRFAIRNSEGA